MKPRRLYHCTTDNHGPTLSVGRSSPRFAEQEPKTPRLCVCQSIPDCFGARLFELEEIHVYRTKSPRKGIRPQAVWDAFLTGERWLIPPMELQRVTIIPRDTVVRAVEPVRFFHMATGNNCTLRMRVASLLWAWEVLGDDYGERHRKRFANKLRRLDLLPCNPLDFILSQAMDLEIAK